ncbi:MAG: WG repeat-containing protein [Rhodocyclales bacterium]|nr:WG repeat-containing protein [Rhodocyclales bacterium]
MNAFDLAQLGSVLDDCAKAVGHAGIWATPEEREAKRSKRYAAFREVLLPWQDALVWLKRSQGPEGDWLELAFSAGERDCLRWHLQRPWRDFGDGRLRERSAPLPVIADWHSVALGAVVADDAGLGALLSRLSERCLAPYDAADLPFIADLAESETVWSFDNGEIHPTPLLCCAQPGVPLGSKGELPVCFPAAWGGLNSHWHGCLHLHAGHTLVVVNAAGLYGVVQLQTLPESGRVVGVWVQSCRWPYLAGPRCAVGELLEAAQGLTPDARGELLCDLIKPLTGERVNPPGVKILAGSLSSRGALAVNEDAADSLRLGRLDRRGQLFCGQPLENDEIARVSWEAEDLRWAAIRDESYGLAAVRCPTTGLWGYVGRRGELLIPPAFERAGSFSKVGAVVWPQDGGGLCGLIDQDGQWKIAPQWQRIVQESERVMVVQDAADAWGALSPAGEVLLSVAPRVLWAALPDVAAALGAVAERESRWPLDRLALADDAIADGVAAEWRRRWWAEVGAALAAGGETLARCAGLFDASTSERDLRAVGLWGRQVRLLADKQDGLLHPRAGELGRIGAYYPVGLSCFDLRQEVPVNGLPTQPEAAIGIAWENLALLDPVLDGGAESAQADSGPAISK